MCSHGRLRFERLSAFTLIELLVVIAIIAVLSGLGFAGLSKAQEYGRRANEIAAAKSLIGGYLNNAHDNDGVLMPGHIQSEDPITLPNGDELTDEEAKRYPWRLAPYIDWNITGIYLINRTKNALAGLDPDSWMYRYRVALSPAMGMNAYCVGGFYDGGDLLCDEDVITRLSQAARPSKTIAFISTRYKMGAENMEGYFYARPPNSGHLKWATASYSESATSDKYGFVHFRYGKKAICVFLDGHTEMLGVDDLRDMRLWAPKAETANYALKL